MLAVTLGGSSSWQDSGFGPGTRGSSPSPPAVLVRLLCEHMFVPRIGPRYTKEQARVAIASSRSWAEALRRLGMCHSGGAHVVLRKYAETLGAVYRPLRPLCRVAWSWPCSRSPARRDSGRELGLLTWPAQATTLRSRPQATRLRALRTRQRGGRRELGMILDHINGISDDNRLENLSIRVSELRSNVRHSLRSRRGVRPRAPSRVAHAAARPFIAQSDLFSATARSQCGYPVESPGPTSTWNAKGRPAALRTTPTRGPRGRIRSHRTSLRSVGQRGSQVDSGLRARAGVD